MSHLPELATDTRPRSEATLADPHHGPQRTGSVGARFWDRFEDFRGGSGSFKGRGNEQIKQPNSRESALLGAFPASHGRSHGKEGVDGSSPSEGFAKVAAYRPLPFAIQTMNWMLDVHRTSTQRCNDRSIAA